MKKNILLPTDFSKSAWHAIAYALELYKNEPCNFFLLNVFSGSSNIIDSLINMEPGSALYEEAKLKSEDGLAKVLDMIALRDRQNPKHNFITISSFNNTLEAIKNVVENKDIEIIIMGTRGQTESKSIVYGRNAISVMEKVRECPVLVIPEIAKIELPKEIVFPTDYKKHFKKRELKYLIEIAKISEAAVKILHVQEENKLDVKQKANKELLEGCFEDISYSFHFLTNMHVPTAINCFVESRESDMVAFINKKHAFFGSILTQPLVKDIGYHSKVPVLVLHDLRN